MIHMNYAVPNAGSASAQHTPQILGFVITVSLHALALVLVFSTIKATPVPSMKLMSVSILALSPAPVVAKALVLKQPVQKQAVRPEKEPMKQLVKRVASTQPAPANIIKEPTSQPVRSDAKAITSVPESATAPVTTQAAEVIETLPPRFDADYLNNPEPHYPAISRRLSEQGRVLLRVHVGTQGQALEVVIYKSSQYERLDQAAQSAVKDWRFVPAKRGNQALSEWVIVPIAFNLSR